MRETRIEPEGAPSIAARALGHLAGLLRKEFELARAETSEKVSQATAALIRLGVAMVAALVAVNALSAAAFLALVEFGGLEATLAALIVGGTLILIATLVVAKAVRDLKPRNLSPTRTVRTLRTGVETIKETIHG